MSFLRGQSWVIETSGCSEINNIFSDRVTEPYLYAQSVESENQGQFRLKLTLRELNVK